MAGAKRVSWAEFAEDCTQVMSLDTGGKTDDPWVVIYGYGPTHDFMAADVPKPVKLMFAAVREREKSRILENIARVMNTGE